MKNKLIVWKITACWESNGDYRSKVGFAGTGFSDEKAGIHREIIRAGRQTKL